MPITSKCEDIINYLKQNGAVILFEKGEESGTVSGKTIILQKDKCKIKLGYLNLGSKQIIVEKLCQCNERNNWSLIPKTCLL